MVEMTAQTLGTLIVTAFLLGIGTSFIVFCMGLLLFQGDKK